MNNHSKLEKLGFVLGILLLVALVYGGFHLISTITDLLRNLDKEVLAAIIGAMATVFAGIAAVLISQKQTKQRDIDESHRSKKVEIYKGFLDAVSGLMARENESVSKSGFNDQELIDYIVEFKTDILLWGSPKVIKCQLAFERASRTDENIFIAVDNLYKAIREDIGLSNKGLKNYELMKMYLKDPDEMEELISSNK